MSKPQAKVDRNDDRPDQDLKHAADDAKRDLHRDAAALRSEPEDRRASARQTTAAGKARSR